MRRGNVKDEVLVRFANVTDRDVVIGHVASLKDSPTPAGMHLGISSHLQSDFKILVQYGNDARKHFGDKVKRSVWFFELEYGLILNVSGKWITVSPNEARVVIKHRKKMEEKSFYHTLHASNTETPSILELALEKA